MIGFFYPTKIGTFYPTQNGRFCPTLTLNLISDLFTNCVWHSRSIKVIAS